MNIKYIFFDLGQTLVDLTFLLHGMKKSLKKHLKYISGKYIDKWGYEWGYETNNLFMKQRKMKFMSMREIHFISLNDNEIPRYQQCVDQL